MNSAALIRHCLNAWQRWYSEGPVCCHTLGVEIAWEDSPSRLAGILKAHLLGPSTRNVSWLTLACAVLTERAEIVRETLAHA